MIQQSQPEPELDDRQREAAEDFCIQACVLRDAASKRFHQCNAEWKTAGRKRFDLACQMRDTILVLRGVFSGLSENINSISTASGTVHPDSSEEYLAQELEREQTLRTVSDWNNDYLKIREEGNRLSRVERDDLGDAELTVCDAGRRTLQSDLGNLDPEEACLRACLVLAEITKKRWQLRRSLLLSPVRSVKQIAVTLATSIPIFGVGYGLAAGGATTVAQYAIEGSSHWDRASELLLPEENAKSIVRRHLQIDRAHVMMCMAEAGINVAPESLVGEPG